MKKLLGFIVFAVIFTVALVLPVSAQDVPVPPNVQIPSNLFALISNFIANHVWITYVLGVLYVFEQILASSKSITANSSWQVACQWFLFIYNQFKPANVGSKKK